MKRLVVLVALAGCQEHVDLRLELGVDGTLSQGFACRDPDTHDLLYPPASGGTIRANLVIDIIALGDGLPSCLGEELVDRCRADADGISACGAIARSCGTFELSVVTLDQLQGDKLALQGYVLDVLRATRLEPPLPDDAPDRPLLARAMLTTQDCTAVRAAYDFTAVFGCIASCPFVPSTLDGAISLGLTTADELCGDEVRDCARFVR